MYGGKTAWKVVRMDWKHLLLHSDGTQLSERKLVKDRDPLQLAIIAALNKEGFSEFGLPPNFVIAVDPQGFLTSEGKKIKSEKWESARVSYFGTPPSSEEMICGFLDARGFVINKENLKEGLLEAAKSKEFSGEIEEFEANKVSKKVTMSPGLTKRQLESAMKELDKPSNKIELNQTNSVEPGISGKGGSKRV